MTPARKPYNRIHDLEMQVRHNSEGWDKALEIAGKYLDRAEAAEAEVARLKETVTELETRLSEIDRWFFGR